MDLERLKDLEGLYGFIVIICDKRKKIQRDKVDLEGLKDL